MTTKLIENLAPTHPYKFRVQVILKTTSVSKLRELVLEHYGDEDNVYKIFQSLSCFGTPKAEKLTISETHAKIDALQNKNSEIYEDDLTPIRELIKINYKRNDTLVKEAYDVTKLLDVKGNHKSWLESSWSEETWTSTEYAGASAGCFCMAVRCGYLKQRRRQRDREVSTKEQWVFGKEREKQRDREVQQMLEIRPELTRVVNSSNGLTALATAVRKAGRSRMRRRRAGRAAWRSFLGDAKGELILEPRRTRSGLTPEAVIDADLQKNAEESKHASC
ncbi:hypothetical protein EVAR_55255_1 [Eumeta japonica]|uniref:Uncharacterized protein n=1 Tax=Eumeta variegata TaxID=151549 RepID=A0A4C1Z4X2_EUMVA|nr:hypothetical protein EVAR_55255_1 [Eumeta japonica]